MPCQISQQFSRCHVTSSHKMTNVRIKLIPQAHTPVCIQTTTWSHQDIKAPNTTTFPYLPFLISQQVKQTQTYNHLAPQRHNHVVPSRHISIIAIHAFLFVPTQTNRDGPNQYFPVSADVPCSSALLPTIMPLSQPKCSTAQNQKHTITVLM